MTEAEDSTVVDVYVHNTEAANTNIIGTRCLQHHRHQAGRSTIMPSMPVLRGMYLLITLVREGSQQFSKKVSGARPGTRYKSKYCVFARNEDADN